MILLTRNGVGNSIKIGAVVFEFVWLMFACEKLKNYRTVLYRKRFRDSILERWFV